MAKYPNKDKVACVYLQVYLNSVIFFLSFLTKTVPNYNYISSVEDLNEKSLIAIMYPLKSDLDKKISDYSSQNSCIIFYPWS